MHRLAREDFSFAFELQKKGMHNAGFCQEILSGGHLSIRGHIYNAHYIV